MKTIADKSKQAEQSRANANCIQQSNSKDASFGSRETESFVNEDNRPEVITQRKLQGLTQSIPQVRQTAQMQEMLDNNTQVQRFAQMQEIIDKKTTRTAQKKQEGVSKSNNKDLGREADVMGTKTLQIKGTLRGEPRSDLQTKLDAQRATLTISVVQRRNGAIVANWNTVNIAANGGFITHDVGWGSSTGDINELDDVLTREEVTWAAGCPWAVEPAYQAAGQHHGMGTTRGDAGQSRDVHQASQPYFDVNNPPLNPGQSMNFVMTQCYQYSTDGGTTWHNIPNSDYTLTRSLYRRMWPFRDRFVYTMTKQGINDVAVNHTTSVTVRV